MARLATVRYQEYAHHICESGGRLLKSSEDALAVTEAMTALMTDRTRGRRERVSVSALLREASEGLEAAAGLRLISCEGFAITCERRADRASAAASPSPRPGPAGGRSLRDHGPTGIRPAVSSCAPRGQGAQDTGSDGAPLHIILARLLLQTQGANLECSSGEGGWSALVGFRRSAGSGLAREWRP